VRGEHTMKRLVQSRKALSPVVAAIILIAVAVAVSIAVSAWIGALTFTFAETEELDILSATFQAGNVTLTIYNRGTSDLTINKIRIGSVAPTNITNVAITVGSVADVTITHSWLPGVKYYYEVITTTGNIFPYTATAP